MFLDEGYTHRLQANCSPREADIIDRSQFLDWRTCELLYDSGESPLTSPKFGSAEPDKVCRDPWRLVDRRTRFGGMGGASCSLNNVKGWVRTRTFKWLDNFKAGIAVAGKGSEMQLVPDVIAVHGI